METPKYELTNETMVASDGALLHRIKALQDFRVGHARKKMIKAGYLGGFIQSVENLSQHGTAWVDDEAQVSGMARVEGGAWVADNARVSGETLVDERASVVGNASVEDNAVVTGASVVMDNSRIFDYARVDGKAIVSGKASIGGNAQVGGQSRVLDNARVMGNAKVKGMAHVSGMGSVEGNVRLDEFDMVKGHVSSMEEKAAMTENKPEQQGASRKLPDFDSFANRVVETAPRSGKGAFER